MTAQRRPRSAWLLVGSTPSRWAKVDGAGQCVSRLVAKRRWYFVLVLFARGLFERRLQLLLERADPFDQAGTIAVLRELVPGREQASCDREAGRAELLLSGEPLAVGGEVPDEVGPAELAPFGLEVVVGPPAIGAGDALEVLAEERLGLA